MFMLLFCHVQCFVLLTRVVICDVVVYIDAVLFSVNYCVYILFCVFLCCQVIPMILQSSWNLIYCVVQLLDYWIVML